MSEWLSAWVSGVVLDHCPHIVTLTTEEIKQCPMLAHPKKYMWYCIYLNKIPGGRKLSKTLLIFKIKESLEFTER